MSKKMRDEQKKTLKQTKDWKIENHKSKRQHKLQSLKNDENEQNKEMFQ